jgi:hypothetical protein
MPYINWRECYRQFELQSTNLGSTSSITVYKQEFGKPSAVKLGQQIPETGLEYNAMNQHFLTN